MALGVGEVTAWGRKAPEMGGLAHGGAAAGTLVTPGGDRCGARRGAAGSTYPAPDPCGKGLSEEEGESVGGCGGSPPEHSRAKVQMVY